MSVTVLPRHYPAGIVGEHAERVCALDQNKLPCVYIHLFFPLG